MHIQVQQSIAACALVAEDAGVAIVDPFTARQWRPMGLAIKPLAVDIPFEICAVAARETPLSMAARQFLTLFEEELFSARAGDQSSPETSRRFLSSSSL